MTATTTRRRTAAAAGPDTSPARSFTRIVGIDMSLTSTGVATLYSYNDLAEIQTIAYTVKVPNDAPLSDRYRRIRHMVIPFHQILGSNDLIVIEGAAAGAVGGHAWDRAAAWWQIVGIALEIECPVVVVNPSTRAKWATGNGRADKAAVAAAMTRRMPDTVFNNSDESDSAALAWMCAQRLGWRPATKTELAALTPIRWPAGVHA